jgi:hypothetical protein
MRKISFLLLILISANSFCQSSIDRTYRFINELIRDNYNDKIVRLDSLPSNDKLFVDGSYLQQNIELINSNLNKGEIADFLKFCDTTKCFLLTDRLELTIKLCDSNSIHITDLNKRISHTVSLQSFKWHTDKIITKSKGNQFYDLAFSEPIINEDGTIMIIHIITSNGVYGFKGETVLFKKINSKWIKICDLYAWIT